MFFRVQTVVSLKVRTIFDFLKNTLVQISLKLQSRPYDYLHLKSFDGDDNEIELLFVHGL